MLYKEINSDLFKYVDSDYILAHCISSDAEMSQGIAKEFQVYFPEMKRFILSIPSEERKPGSIAIFDTDNSYVVNLVTKDRFYEKPKLKNIIESLYSLRDFMIASGIKQLAIPMIASGLDGHKWVKIRQHLKTVFMYTDIEIVVCKFKKES